MGGNHARCRTRFSARQPRLRQPGVGASYQLHGGGLVDPILCVSAGGSCPAQFAVHPYSGPNLHPSAVAPGAALDHANLVDVDLFEAILTGADLTGADVSSFANLTDAATRRRAGAVRLAPSPYSGSPPPGPAPPKPRFHLTEHSLPELGPTPKNPLISPILPAAGRFAPSPRAQGRGTMHG